MGFWMGVLVGWLVSFPCSLLLLAVCGAGAREDRMTGRDK